MSFHASQSADLGIATVLWTFVSGFRMDLSFATYLSLLPALLIIVFNDGALCKKVIKIYTAIGLFFLNLLMLVDMQLYQHWQFRLDATLMRYMNTPKDMLASNTNLEIILFVILLIGLTWAFVYGYSRIFKKSQQANQRTRKEIPFSLSAILLLGIFLRGGVQEIPLNQSNVYFSNKPFANHAAVNFAWNFLHSVLKNSKHTKNHFALLGKEEAANLLAAQRTKRTSPDSLQQRILKKDTPNVILIIWESFTAKVVEPLGGEAEITAHFNALTKEGILFSNFYANGDRTDKGLVAILSGYYPQPNASILKMPKKSQQLPTLTAEMAKKGYHNSFFYGGDLNFANMYSYLLGKEIPTIINRNDYKTNSSSANSKWGVYDHLVFDSLVTYLTKTEKEPFFSTLMTLSSHEPFDIPIDYKFGKGDDVELFRSSLAYTDQSLGDFIAKAKLQPWWDNTLIIILADHGHRNPPRDEGYNPPSQYHIPMLWLGGALQVKDTVISNIGAQSDVAYTLLDLLKNEGSAKFPFSNNILEPSPNHYAHYIFNHGFGTVCENGFVTYDYTNKKVIQQQGEKAAEIERLGKAITQQAYQDFLDR